MSTGHWPVSNLSRSERLLINLFRPSKDGRSILVETLKMKTTFRDHVRALAVEWDYVPESTVDAWINAAGIVRAAESLACHAYIYGKGMNYRLGSALLALSQVGSLPSDS